MVYSENSDLPCDGVISKAVPCTSALIQSKKHQIATASAAALIDPLNSVDLDISSVEET
jgi:hypothetical protein